MRTPLFTVVTPILALGLFVASVVVGRWVKYEQDGLVSAHVGLFKYEVTESATGSEPTHWMAGIDCSATTSKSDCDIWHRAVIAIYVLIGFAQLLLIFAWRTATFGSGITVGKLFWAFIFNIAALITFAALYERIRIPAPAAHTRHAAGLASTEIIAGQVGHGVDLVIGAKPDLDDVSFTLDTGFFLYAGGIVLVVATLLHHGATCSKRKFEEL